MSKTYNADPNCPLCHGRGTTTLHQSLCSCTKTVYRGYSIEPKRDFGSQGFLINGRTVTAGYVAVKDSCNPMPGGTWFETVDEAKEAIDVLIEVKGNAERFWEIMQPFQYKHVGQKADFENGSITCGRNSAVVENGRVVKLTRVNRRGEVIVHKPIETKPRCNWSVRRRKGGGYTFDDCGKPGKVCTTGPMWQRGQCRCKRHTK